MTNNRLRESIRRNLITEIQNACDGQGLSSSQYQDCLTNCCDAGDSDCCNDLGTDEMTVGGNDNELENIGIKGIRRNDKDMAKRRPYSAKARDMRGSVKDMREGRRRLSEAAMCWNHADCPGGHCNRDGGNLSQDGKTGRCMDGPPPSPFSTTGGGKGVPDREDVMRKKNRMRSAANAIGDLKEYTRNRTNIERFLNEKEDKEMGTPDPKKVLAIAKKVLTGGNPPSTGMNNWWCCLLACPDPGCKGDRWEVVMHPWG